MLEFLISWLIPDYAATPFRLIDYVTFRAGAALMTAFLICVIAGPAVIRRLRKAVAPERLEGLVDKKFIDENKGKTPSMGGLLVVMSIIVSSVLWGKFSNSLSLVFIATLFAFSLLGFIDDYLKVAKKGGLGRKPKLLFQTLITGCSLWFVYLNSPETFNQFCVPFLKEPLFVMPTILAFVFGWFVVVGSSNAVNLTDGKDGLAVGCTIFCVLTYGAIAYMTGHKIFAGYLNLNYIPASSEVVVFATSIAGACIGFLWFNCHPAAVFMGDTGSLALGGAVGLIAVLVKQEVLLILVGGVFVMEIGSAMLQILSVKLTGKRIFKCTPIHHHFEMSGWTETQIVVRFWILAGLFALAGLASLKLR